jgi:cytoskeletal protein CcmA (bactofilin family)
MEIAARIGPSIRIKGDVQSGEPLVVAGHVDGTVEVSEHPLTIDPGGSIEATVLAHTIVVSGKANGLLSASVRVVIRNTANVGGDVSAPIISLADGAIVNARIETTRRHEAPAALGAFPTESRP